MSAPQKFRSAVTLAAVLVCLAPLAGQAKDGRDDDSSSSGGVDVVSAAACTELPAAGVASARSGGAFLVRDGAAATLICPLPTADLNSSPSDPKPVGFEVGYLDGDGPGIGGVSVRLVRTTLAATPDGFADSAVCTWASSGGALIGTTAGFVCVPGIVEGGFYHLRVDLASTPGSAAAFIGIAARD